ncbi:anti-sigma factor [Humibacter ginsengiterrae]
MSETHDDDAQQDDARLLAAGHALGSLSPGERERYERLLQSSPDARAEASAFADVAAALDAASAEAEPPADLKARLMAQIAVTPQEQPGERQATDERASTPSQQAAPHADPESGPGAAPAEVRTPTRAEREARRRWYSRPLVAAAAAAAAVVLFAGGTAVGFSIAQHPQSTAQADVLASITSAPDAQRSLAKVAGGGTATLVWSASLGKSAMIVHGVPAAPAGKTYQLWYIRDGRATSAGLMSGQWDVLHGSMRAGDVVGLTVEPAGGSKQPTTKPVVTIAS